MNSAFGTEIEDGSKFEAPEAKAMVGGKGNMGRRCVGCTWLFSSIFDLEYEWVLNIAP
jgi:hypothetical protein